MLRLNRVRERMRAGVDLFATPLKASHYVELVNPLWSAHRLQARVEAVHQETSDARTITLRPGRNWRRHRAGQHLRLGVGIGGRRFTRTYSISSSPERRDGCITITVKVLEGGRMSGHLVRDLAVGAHLPIGLPQGDFLVPEATPVRPLFVTGGSGITPVMSMLRTWDLVGNMPDAVHLHHAPSASAVIFGSELEEMALRRHRYRYHPVLTREGRAPGASHLSEQRLDELCPDWRERDVWACGPQALLDAVDELYAKAGRASAVHLERFRAPLADVPDDASGGAVGFLCPEGEVRTDVDSTTPLLRAAEDAGLNPAHGCRMGICHTCDVALVGGRVRDLRTGEVIDEPGTGVQICIAGAAGDCTIDLTPTLSSKAGST